MPKSPAHVFRWDLDKTYLRTDFDKLSDLLKSAFEKPSDKKSFPGASALLRSLQTNTNHRLCIVSGSPTQMRGVLKAKLAMDGVRADEFVLKNNLRNLLRGRFRSLRSQLPYKLPALLESRLSVDGVPHETLVGDDAEVDALAYSIYADILAGQISSDELQRILLAARAYPDEIDRTLHLARQTPVFDCVNTILIHLESKSPTDTFAKFGHRVVPFYNYFQCALLLHTNDLLSLEQLLFVAGDMLQSAEFETEQLANSLQDLVMRGKVSVIDAQTVAKKIKAASLRVKESSRWTKNSMVALHQTICSRLAELGHWQHTPSLQKTIDYVTEVDKRYG